MYRDPTLDQLAALEPSFAATADAMISALREFGFPAVIVQLGGRRSLDEQRALVRAGRSRTLYSRHIDGLAFDLDMAGYSRDEVPRWFWDAVGPWAEQNFGLRWGGRWTRFRDVGHFER